ncbi:MAG: acetyltransferase [Syntrophomonas sp.]
MLKNTSRPLVIAGAGGLGREVACFMTDPICSQLNWNLLGFADDNKQGATIEGLPILGPIRCLFDLPSLPWVLVAIAHAHTRRRIFKELKEGNIPIATFVHPNSTISSCVHIGEGSIVCSGSILTTNVTLGNGCIINPGCFVGHDTVLGDWTSLMPHAKIAGEVTVGEGSYFGINSTVINRTSIGEWSVIGAGAAVTGDIPSFSLAVGVPARVVKKFDINY